MTSLAKHASKSASWLWRIHTPYMILTPGGKVATNELAMHTLLKLAEKVYKTSLIVLAGQGINIILGMGWMKVHKSLLDIAAHIIHLDSPVHGVTTLQLTLPFVPTASVHHTTASVHHTTAENLEDIR
jgi:hypothetical protein